jgi:hypothetical protein
MRAIAGICGSFRANEYYGGRNRAVSLLSPQKSGFAFPNTGSHSRLTFRKKPAPAAGFVFLAP